MQYIRKHTGTVETSLKLQIAPVIEKLKTEKPDMIDIHLDEEPVRLAFAKIYTHVGYDFASRTHRDLTGKGRKDEYDDIWRQEMMSYVNAFLGDRIVSITGTSKDIAQKIMKQLVNTVIIPDGMGIEEASRLFQREFKKNYVQTTLARARVIAQTEILTASNKGAQMGAEQAGARVKVWQTSGISDPDGNDRHVSYPGLHGQERGISEAYDVGGHPAKYPGDHTLPVGEVVNCKCAEVWK